MSADVRQTVKGYFAAYDLLDGKVRMVNVSVSGMTAEAFAEIPFPPQRDTATQLSKTIRVGDFEVSFYYHNPAVPE